MGFRTLERVESIHMKTVSFFAVLMSLVLCAACASGSRTQASPAEMAALDHAVSDGEFEILATWAQPMASRGLNSIANAGLLPPGSSAGRIDIAGTGGFLKMVGDSAIADLPYFGDRHMGGGYGTQGSGIKFAGIPENYSMGPVKKGDGYTMEFNIREGQETYRVLAHIFASRYASINIASSHRSTIWYQGRLQIEEAE